MAKPDVAPQKSPPKPRAKSHITPIPDPGSPQTFKRLRLVRKGNDEYELWEDTHTSQPALSRPLHMKLSRVSAIYWAKLWHEDFIGPNRTGDTGL